MDVCCPLALAAFWAYPTLLTRASRAGFASATATVFSAPRIDLSFVTSSSSFFLLERLDFLKILVRFLSTTSLYYLDKVDVSETNLPLYVRLFIPTRTCKFTLFRRLVLSWAGHSGRCGKGEGAGSQSPTKPVRLSDF